MKAESLEESRLLKSILAIDINKCTGCKNCELACSIKHTNSFNPKRSRIQVLKNEDKNMILPMVCLQCEVPLCEQACPNGALAYNEKDTLYVRSDVCIGCANCVTACTFGGIEIDPMTRKAIKCDLCSGDPACVKACDYSAISFVEVKNEGFDVRSKGTEPVYQTLGIKRGALRE